MSTEGVVLKSVPAMTVASVREVIPTYADMGKHYEEIFAYIGEHGVAPAGPALCLYYDMERKEQDIDVESAVPVAGTAPSGERVKIRELPAMEQVASLVHRGSYEGFTEAYGQLLGWIEANGYQIVAPNREIYLTGPGPGIEPSDYVTELQFPVGKA